MTVCVHTKIKLWYVELFLHEDSAYGLWSLKPSVGKWNRTMQTEDSLRDVNYCEFLTVIKDNMLNSK